MYPNVCYNSVSLCLLHSEDEVFMPVSIIQDPFSKCPSEQPALPELRTPQARVMAALVPSSSSVSLIDWPTVNRTKLGVRAGYTAISGSITRALNGIHKGSSSGDAHLGLIALGYVEELILDIDGIEEVNYRATPAGVRAYTNYLAQHGGIPALRDASVCTNRRYRKES